ncbi:AMP-binding protein [Arenibacter certesii]|uniref:O-succinylbenzoic acid--CoA ligase n=1 Tax=Arenibacter certesii TaxID=228955 RepID=A0A918IU30_9FLAO|nr:AMP-binding protein [Arenibacter certesii]GGW32162.1 O-succinylbenzoic acid--CoA ligase [Arenibacter certesii]
MELTYKFIHPKFKFNGNHYDYQELLELAYSLVKEGEDYEMAIGDFLLDWLDGSKTVHVSTSGSTGVPKIIPLQKNHMVNSALATGEFFKMKAGTKALHCLPTSFIAGKMMLVRAIVLGWDLQCVVPNSHPMDLAKGYYDFVAMVPLQVENSLTSIDQIDTLIVGGAPMSGKLISKMASISTVVFETYGMTETITHIAAKRINVAQENNIHNESSLNFNALPEVAFSKDHRGCLVIEAPHISDVVVVTNDLVNLISNTEFEWLGRYDNVINSGGLKLIPEQIETQLATIVTNRFFVTGITDATLGQKLILVVEGQVDSSSLLKDIKSMNSLNKYQIPKEIYTLPKLIETGSGKVNRAESLRALGLN